MIWHPNFNSIRNVEPYRSRLRCSVCHYMKDGTDSGWLCPKGSTRNHFPANFICDNCVQTASPYHITQGGILLKNAYK